MRVILKPHIIVLSPETDAERADFALWVGREEGHVFHLVAGTGKGAALHDLGVREAACREPINIIFEGGDPQWRPISNLAETPFELHSERYASVEGFWQGLKFPSPTDRRRVAALAGKEAKSVAHGLPVQDVFVYGGQSYSVGRYEHWSLMRQACQAKFSQNAVAREVLMATGERPLTHRVRRDSRTIPGALLADIWMRIRARLAASGETVPPR